MKIILEEGKFDTKVEASDWRYSAAIVGLYKYLIFYGEEGIDFKISEDAIEFNQSDLTEKKYLAFVEYYYGEELQHKKLENMMALEEYSDEQISIINELLKGNSVLKKTFGKKKFDGTNQKEIKELIEENRETLIKETSISK